LFHILLEDKDFFWIEGVRGLLIESKTIGHEEVEIFRSSRYRVTTILPLEKQPVMNVYLFNLKELEDYLGGYSNYAEFVISIEQTEALA
jgi:hypothetical protein